MNEDRPVFLAQYFDYLKWGVVLFTTMVSWLLAGSGVLDWGTDEPKAGIFLFVVCVIWVSWSTFLARLRQKIAATGPDVIGELRLGPIPRGISILATGTAWFAVFDKLIDPRHKDFDPTAPAVALGVAVLIFGAFARWRTRVALAT